MIKQIQTPNSCGIFYPPSPCAPTQLSTHPQSFQHYIFTPKRPFYTFDLPITESMGRSAYSDPSPPKPDSGKLENDNTSASGSQDARTDGQRWSWLAPLEQLAPDPEILYFSTLESQTTLRASFDHAFDAQEQELPALSQDPAFEITCSEDDKSNPKTWPAWYRNMVLACVSYSTLVV